MKRIFLLICFSMSFSSLLSPFSSLLSLSAQIPHHFNYQAIIRGNNGEPLVNQDVNIRISLLLGSATGLVSYQETHQTATNVFGLVNLAIGNGTPVTGVYDTIAWSSHSYLIKVEVDPAGGNNFTDMGTVQLLAVPYALHAENATSAVVSELIQDSDQDTRVTTEENPDEDKIRFLVDGAEKLRIEPEGLIFSNPSQNVIISDYIGPDLSQTGWNTIMGYSAGQSNQNGWYNTFIGHRSGWKHTTGSDNTYIGVQSGREDISGDLNTFIGCDAGVFSKTGSRNTFIGYGAGFNNNEGNYNTSLGFMAGGGNENGNSNVFIGYKAGRYFSGSNLLIIENSDANDPLIYGEFDNDLLRFNATRLELRNPLENTILGDSAGIATTGNMNVFVGFKAGFSNTTGSGNIFIGDSTGYENTTGGGNVFIGGFAGWLNTIGNSNLFAGGGAGMKNTEGGGNVILGTTSGFENTTGDENVFIGMSAGVSNTTGSFNTYVGRRAGLMNQTGEYNVFIGYRAGAQELGSKRLYIANSGTTTPLIYGEFDNALLKFHAQVNVVDHDVYINDATKGIILTAPGGQCYRVTVADDGTLVSTAVDCP